MLGFQVGIVSILFGLVLNILQVSSFSSFHLIIDNGAKFDPTMKLKRNFANIYSSVPPVDYTELARENPTIKEEIIEFFEFIEVPQPRKDKTDYLAEIG